MAQKIEQQQIVELIDELDVQLQQHLCDDDCDDSDYNDVFDIHCMLEQLKELVEEKVN